MKSIKRFAYLSAIALVSAGFSACNNQTEEPNQGNYSGEAVKTQFTINIPNSGNAGNGARRMPNQQAQTAKQFNGMDSITIIPFSTGNNGADLVVAASTRIGDSIVLSAVANSGLTGNANYKVYSNVSIPLGTNHFLFYAKGSAASANTDPTPGAQSFQHGNLTTAGLNGATPAGITFTPVQINTTIDNSSTKDAVAQKICDYLTFISKTNESDGTTTAAWSAGGVHANQNYIDLYNTFIGFNSTSKIQAGSSASIRAMIEDLYNTVKKDNTVIGDSIAARILNASYGVTVKGGTTVPNAEIEFPTALSNYPQKLHLPDGAAAIAWQTDKFVIVNSSDWAAVHGTTLDVADVTKYVYPACIYYYANSGLKSSSEKQSDNYGTKYWKQILDDLYDESDNYYVKTNTRSVAIKDSIQYGVARLATCVKANAALLADKTDVAMISKDSLQVTGILVGGQGQVKFDFTTDTEGSYIVYDSILNTLNQALTNPTDTNSTLVLETKPATDVRMAVEFLNIGRDFLGVDSVLIPKGTHFYIVAQLPQSAATETDNKVFKQDYVTKVNLNLKSVKQAYNVIPDLRSSQLELGFSVDLAWKAGHVYNLDIE